MNKNINKRVKFLSRFGKFVWYSCYYTRAIKIYELGDYFGFIFNWWHPATWLAFLFCIIPTAYLGIHTMALFPIKMDEWWVLRDKKELVWL